MIHDPHDIELPENDKFKKYIPIAFPPRIANELLSLFPKFKVKNRKHMKAAVNFPPKETSKRSALIYGPAGTGKTFFACMMIIFCRKNAWNYLKYAVEFRSVPDLLNNLKSLMNTNSKELNEKTGLNPYYHEINTLCKCRYLILDDLGAEKNSEFTNEVLYHIINERYNTSKNIIITSNISPGALKKAGVSSRLLSRVQSMSGVNIFNLTRQMRQIKKPVVVKLE